MNVGFIDPVAVMPNGYLFQQPETLFASPAKTSGFSISAIESKIRRAILQNTRAEFANALASWETAFHMKLVVGYP
jgi:hypothetical protein